MIYTIVLVVHASAWVKRTPHLVLAAISLMIGTISTTVLYAALKWIEVPKGGQLVGLIIALLLLAYAIHGSLKSKGPPVEEIFD